MPENLLRVPFRQNRAARDYPVRRLRPCRFYEMCFSEWRTIVITQRVVGKVLPDRVQAVARIAEHRQARRQQDIAVHRLVTDRRPVDDTDRFLRAGRERDQVHRQRVLEAGQGTRQDADEDSDALISYQGLQYLSSALVPGRLPAAVDRVRDSQE